MPLVIALDIGGTFTDLVAFDLTSGSVHQAKISTTPHDLSVGIAGALTKSGLKVDAAEAFVHGSTVAINAAIERTGARTALLVTKGMRDVYQIGRGGRPEAYNFHFQRPQPYVPRRLTFEIDERLDAAGSVISPLDTENAKRTILRLLELDVKAVAVCLIHSWSNPDHEKLIGRLISEKAPGLFCSLSYEILREYREYERTSTTVLNAYVGPRVANYLQDLERLLHERRFSGKLLIMQSNGGGMSVSVAKRIPVATMESGPVGGIIAAAETADKLSCPNIIAFDMGGTTAKVSLVRDSRPSIAQGYYVGGPQKGLPVMYPVVDIVEVGAGGGSIAWIDEVGAFKVGPRSAGGHPGPVCYGQGGLEPTVTDANVVLGRLSSDCFLGGEMPLNAHAARECIARRIAEPLGLSVVEAALGIIKIASAEMALAVRSVSVARGHDPRDFAMVAFGGAGPLHAAEIARELHIPTLIIPRLPGHFSALGMLLADHRHDFVRTYYYELDVCDCGVIEGHFREMADEGRNLLAEEGVASTDIRIELFFDMRYVGQEFPITTPVELRDIETCNTEALRRGFDRLHEQRYGQDAPEESVELVNLRLTAIGRRTRLSFPELEPQFDRPQPIAFRSIFLSDPGSPTECAIYDRSSLGPGQAIHGPASIVEYASTTQLFEEDSLMIAPTGDLIISIGPQNE